MKPTADEEADLTRFVDRALRDLPPRPAPAELQARVMRELARRAALPWWQQSFLGWPIWVRITFILGCLLAARGTLQVSARLAAPVAAPMSWLQAAGGWLTFLRSLFDHLGGALLQGISMTWIYFGLLLVGALYVLLAGLGAAAYRTLYVSR